MELIASRDQSGTKKQTNSKTKHSFESGSIQSWGEMFECKAQCPPPSFLLFMNHIIVLNSFILAGVPAENIANDRFLHNKVFPWNLMCRSQTFNLRVWIFQLSVLAWIIVEKWFFFSFVNLVISNFSFATLTSISPPFMVCKVRWKNCLSNHCNASSFQMSTLRSGWAAATHALVVRVKQCS